MFKKRYAETIIYEVQSCINKMFWLFCNSQIEMIQSFIFGYFVFYRSLLVHLENGYIGKGLEKFSSHLHHYNTYVDNIYNANKVLGVETLHLLCSWVGSFFNKCTKCACIYFYSLLFTVSFMRNETAHSPSCWEKGSVIKFLCAPRMQQVLFSTSFCFSNQCTAV